MNFLNEENKTKHTKIQILSENQSEKQEFIFPKNIPQEKVKSNTEKTTSNRFLVLARENAFDLQPPSLTIDLQEQSCSRKETTSIRATPNNDKKSDKPKKDLSKKNSNSSREIKSSDVITVILGEKKIFTSVSKTEVSFTSVAKTEVKLTSVVSGHYQRRI